MRTCRASLLLAALALGLMPGCRKEESIEQYTVDYPDRAALDLRVAILPHGDNVYFVRLAGPAEIIKKHVQAFETFVKSVRFEAKKDEPAIDFTAPAGWKKDRPIPGRVASYRIEGDDLEVKVTEFPRARFAILPNIQRWQKELNLPLAFDVADAEKLTKTDKIGAQPVTWVAMNGNAIPKASAPPMDAAPGPRQHPPVARGGETPFHFETPKDWVRKAPTQFSAVRFEVESKGQAAEITLTRLGGDGGGLAANLTRWRGQIGLPPVPETELLKSLVAIKVAGKDARYADLANPNGPPAKNRILAVILPLGQETWFIRMSGPHDWVGQNQSAFETFVKSFKLDAR